MRPVHYCSLIPVYLESIFKDKTNDDPIVLSSATGCLYKHDNKIYLITNWHVLSGRHSINRKILNPNLATPEIIKVHFPLDSDTTQQINKDFELKNSNDEFLWLEHHESNKIDVGILEIDPPNGIATKYISDLPNSTNPVGEDYFFVTQDVWVIGFPRGIRAGGMPLWKSATIATEPIVSTKEHLHKVILDTATREGMSGSPVLYVNKTLSKVRFDGTNHTVDLPSVKLMLGIYSGRIAGDDELAAQLGIAWKQECILEIIVSGRNYIEK
jgi:hypothetical protein